MDKATIDNNFTYHAPNDEQARNYVSLRKTAKTLAMKILKMCPDSREKDAAIAAVEVAVMQANASIARHTEQATESTE